MTLNKEKKETIEQNETNKEVTSSLEGKVNEINLPFERRNNLSSFWLWKNNETNNRKEKNKLGQEVVSITYEEIGLFPRSFSRVLDRFLKQIFSDVENLVIQEYRFYRYLFLTTLKCLLILFFVPFIVNFLAKTYLVRPLTEFFWNTKQTEIFLNSYQQKRAFAELKEFEEKTYFESLIFPKSVFKPNLHSSSTKNWNDEVVKLSSNLEEPLPFSMGKVVLSRSPREPQPVLGFPGGPYTKGLSSVSVGANPEEVIPTQNEASLTKQSFPLVSSSITSSFLATQPKEVEKRSQEKTVAEQEEAREEGIAGIGAPISTYHQQTNQETNQNDRTKSPSITFNNSNQIDNLKNNKDTFKNSTNRENNSFSNQPNKEITESLINSYTIKSSLFVYQTQEADKNIQQRYQEKTIELAQRYNDQSIEAITNFFADLISLFTLFYLLYILEIQINITKSFLLEVFFGLDDSKKSLLILLITDLLVGYHSSNLWELFFEFLFHHYGLPESQTGIFLLVATLPVLLDVLFKYLIFRHLNRSSPATVATYHAMIE
jgi:hypothetical protein